VLDAAGGGVLEPVGGALGDVEFAVGIVGRAVAAGLVVGAGAVDRCRRSGRRGSRSSTGAGRRSWWCRRPRIRVAVAFLEQGGFGRVVAQQIEVGVGEVGLESRRRSGMPTASRVSSMAFHECMPPQQISPSAARRSPCSAATFAGFAEGLGDLLGVAGGILGPVGPTPPAESMRMMPYSRTPWSLRIWRCGRPSPRRARSSCGPHRCRRRCRRPCPARPAPRASRP
jgi:hypothetical protein